ncbi:MAG: Dps family protein [Steroidobacteraceae bacterium]
MANHESPAQAAPGSSPVKTGLPSTDRRQLAQSVGKALAETYVLYTKTQAIHWNVVGPLFYALHKLTEQQYEDLAEAIDELAERIRALDSPAPGSFGEFLELSDIRETREKQTAEQAVMMLCADHEMAACTFREATRMATDCDDVVTADLLTERMGVHEKAAWMLRSLVQKCAIQRTAASTQAKRQ